jgi:multidrug efflux pump subunit AcrB
MNRADLYKGPISWMARNPVAANLLMVALLVGGLIMALQIRQEVFPQMELDYVNVVVPYPGASPEEVEQGILLAVEEVVRPLDGVKEVTSSASEGMGSVRIELETGTNRNKALADIKNGIDRIPTFPEEAERPIVSIREIKIQALTVVVHGAVGEKVLHELGEQARDKLLSHPEISYVELQGIKPLEIAIELSQDTLRAHDLTLSQVADRVRRTALDLPAGALKTKGGDVLLRTAERRDLGREFADIPAVTSRDGTTITLGEIATINDGYAEIDMEARFEGEPCVLINVYAVGDESPTDVAQASKEVAQGLTKTLPPGISVTTWGDLSEIYADRLDLLLRNAAIGLALVLVILGLFLEPRLAFWVTMGIPISFMGSFLVLPALDVSLNMISLFAFIVTLGMVVDDAIVVGENTFRMRREGRGLLESSVRGARQMAMPVTFSIATTVAAFSPLLFIPGTRGKFFFVIPVVAISVLLISLIESFFILPAHLSHVGKPGRLMGAVIRYQQVVSRGVERFIENLYAPLMRAALRQRWITVAIAVCVGLSSCGLLVGGKVEQVDFPKEEGDWIQVDAGLHYGVSVEETRQVMDKILVAAKEVIAENGGERINRGLLSVLGQAETNRSRQQQGTHLTQVFATLVPTDQRDIGSQEFAEQWRKKIGDIPGLEFIKFDATTGRGDTPPIDVRLSHRDPEVLEAAAGDLARELGTFAGLKDIDDGIELGKPQLDFTVSPEGSRAGLTALDIASQVRSSFYGAEALRQQHGRYEQKVMVRLPRGERESLENVEEMIVRTPSGGQMPLRAAAEIDHGRAYTEINRVNGKRNYRVQAGVFEDEANAQEVMGTLAQKTMPELTRKHPGLNWERAGRQKSMEEFMQFLAIGFSFALLAIYGLIAVPLRSALQPFFVVMMAIPFGFVGAVLGHWLMGLNWSIVSWMGFVALSGVVVNDSLVFVAAANRFRARGMDRFAAADAAARQRFRPIILTSLTTFGGLAPMIFETSVQARILVPMAVSLGFGVMFSTMVILLLVPSLFVIIERPRERWRKRREVRLSEDPLSGSLATESGPAASGGEV